MTGRCLCRRIPHVLIAALFTLELGIRSSHAAPDGQKVTSPPGVPQGVHDAPVKPAPGVAFYREVAKREALQAGLPPQMADSIMAVESGYNPDIIGSSGEIGLMQILPSTARMLGFAGSAAGLFDPEANIHFGVRYLARAWQLAGGDICTAAMKYRAGHGETRFSYRSVDYCLAVRRNLASRGFAVTGIVPVATFGDADVSSAAGQRPRCGARRFLIGSPLSGTADFAALNKRINQMVVQVTVRTLPMK